MFWNTNKTFTKHFLFCNCSILINSVLLSFHRNLNFCFWIIIAPPNSNLSSPNCQPLILEEFCPVMANKCRLNNFLPSIFNSRQDIEFTIGFQCCLCYSPRIQKSSIYFRRIFSLSGHVECFAMGTEATLLLAGVPLKPLWFAPMRPLASQYPFEILYLVDNFAQGSCFL